MSNAEFTATVTEATGTGGAWATVIVAEALAPADVAVTVVEPDALPVTSPSCETEAIAELATLQVNTAPEIGCPVALNPVATNVLV